MGENDLVTLEMQFIRLSCSFIGNLFFPWNFSNQAGEQLIFTLIHTMKKNIL